MTRYIILGNVDCFTFGLRSVASWEGQTDVKAFVSGVRWLVWLPVSFSSFLFFVLGVFLLVNNFIW